MGESHGPNEGLCCRFRRGGSLSAVAAVLAFTSKVSAFVPLSRSVRGFEGFASSLHPTSASHRRGSSSRRRQSSRTWVGGARGGSSGGMTMDGGGGDEEGGRRRIEESEGGVSMLTVTVGGRDLSFETGKVGRQASGAVMARDGETVVYSTACTDRKTTTSNFSPLRVDYMERFSAAGMTSGGYNKRDGRASDKETLVSRLMDRPLRPAMHPGWFHETQLLSWVLSYDTVHPPVPLAITAASAALALSNVPLVRAIAGVTVGMDSEGELVVNPEISMAAMSPLNLTIAGTADGVLMIEGESDFVGEEDMMRAIEVGHAAVRDLCLGIEEWSEVAGKEKKTDTLRLPPEGLDEIMERDFQDKVDHALFESGEGKDDQSSAMRELTGLTREALQVAEGEEPGNGRFSPYDVETALKKLYSKRLRTIVKETGRRCDGRKTDEVRPISIETGLLPRTHGSCLFTRGDTQAIATVTLGGSGSSQKTDGITGMIMKHFYLQYTFPPSCVGETGRIGGPGRREVGHGALAEKALSYTVPAVNDFPYTIRVESLVTESCGSSSMASVCGGSLAMMDAGIPVSSPIAGVAMGLLLDEEGGSGEEAVVLTDILGLEDALGTMDFKVAGNDKGITTFQLDIKCAGLTTALLGRALTQAKAGRLHILGEMQKAQPDGPRKEISPFVPTATIMSVDPDQIGKIIGPGGKIIRQIIEDFSLDGMDVEEDGRVMISAFNSTSAASAVKYIEEMLKDVTLRGGGRGGAGGGGGRSSRGVPADFNTTAIIGTTYRDCEVVSIQPFGAFVEFAPGLEGLVHVSELDVNRVVTAEGFLADKPAIDVKVIGLNDKGKVRLSRKAVLVDERGGKTGGADVPSPPRKRPNGALASGGALGVVKRAAPAAATPKAVGAAKKGAPLSAAVEGPAGGGEGEASKKGG